MKTNEVTIILLISKSVGTDELTALADKAKPFACRIVAYSDSVGDVIDPMLWTRIKGEIISANTEYICIVQKSYFEQGCGILTGITLYENGNQHCPDLMHCHQVGRIGNARRSSFDLSCDFCVGRKADFMKYIKEEA